MIPPADLDNVAALLQALHTGRSKDRRRAVRILAQSGAAPDVVLPALVGVLRDRDAAVRLEAAHALADRGEAVVPALVAACGGEDADLCRAAVTTLGLLGPHAHAAIPVLIKLRAKGEVAREATAALRQVRGERATDLVPLLLGLSRWTGQFLVFVAAIAAASWVLGQAQGGPAVLAAAWGMIGTALGAVFGASRWGRAGLVIGALVLGLGGAAAGGLAGSLADPVAGTLNRALRGN